MQDSAALHWTGPAIGWAIAAAGAVVAYLALLVVLAAPTRPRRPGPGPETMDLPGDEPPAIAGFLTNCWKVPGTAMSATVVDLAARRVIDIEEVAPDEFLVRIREPAPQGLRAYEQRVFDRIAELADTHGVVPCRALTTGRDAVSTAWRRAFTREVITDARARGLSRRRWRVRELALPTVAAALPAALGLVAFAIADAQDGSDWSYTPIAVGFALASIPLALRSERDTARGRAVCAQWLGLRALLEDDEAFADYPASAVAIWNRHLAYGAAFGVARSAIATVPMGTDALTEAWSKESGRWRLLHISYRSWPPGWGRSPAGVLVSSGFTALVSAFVVVAGARFATAAALTSPDIRAVAMVTVVIVELVAACCLVASIVWFRYAVSDLRARHQVEGRLLRLRIEESENGVDTWAAVDDGTATDALHAWHLQNSAPDDIVEGCLVRATVTPKLGHVSNLVRVDEPGATVPARRTRTSASIARRLRDLVADPPDEVVLDAHPAPIVAARGAQWTLHRHREADEDRSRELWEYVDGRGGRVVVRSQPSSSLSRRLSRRATKTRQRVDGVGDWAVWSPRDATLTVVARHTFVLTTVLVPDESAEAKRDIAIALTGQLVARPGARVAETGEVPCE
jgi:hypothetical protein